MAVDPRPHSVSIDLVVPPRMCDAQGMVHASRYLDFVEDCFLAWLDHHGTPYSSLLASGHDLVLGSLSIRYRQPARLGQQLVVSATPTATTRSTITIEFVISGSAHEVLTHVDATYVTVGGEGTAPLPRSLTGLVDP